MKKIGSWYLPDKEVHFVNNMKETGDDGYQIMHRQTILSEEQRKNCFLKIDVQGHEESVLDGAKMFMEKYGPAICIEFRANKEINKKWFEWFTKRNYTLIAEFKKEHLFIPEGRNNIRT